MVVYQVRIFGDVFQTFGSNFNPVEVTSDPDTIVEIVQVSSSATESPENLLFLACNSCDVINVVGDCGYVCLSGVGDKIRREVYLLNNILSMNQKFEESMNVPSQQRQSCPYRHRSSRVYRLERCGHGRALLERTSATK